MNKHQERLMDKPSIITRPYCAVCGKYGRTEAHHVVPRSQGGLEGPTVDVCGFGNSSGCHGWIHAHRIHLDWNDEGFWEICYTGKKGMKYEEARSRCEWWPIRRRDQR